MNNDSFVEKIKLFLKKQPWVFSMINRLMTPSWSATSAKKAIRDIPKGAVILNLGSGVTRIREDVTNVDFYPFENVDVVADISKLPFEDGSADAIICECVLEHVPNPTVVVSEMHRVMKKGAVVYVIVPFVFPFHSSPDDFNRWSRMGLRELFRDFDEVDSGIHFGAGHAVCWILSEYLGTVLSFGSKTLQNIFFMVFLVLFTPLNYLDFILNKFKTSGNIASHIYFLGRKK